MAEAGLAVEAYQTALRQLGWGERMPLRRGSGSAEGLELLREGAGLLGHDIPGVKGGQMGYEVVALGINSLAEKGPAWWAGPPI
jgi:hypothetical protein